VGLRNSWRLRNGMRVGGSFERVNPLKGPSADEGPSTAVAGSLDWTEDPRWKGSARMEVRSSNAADQVLQTMAGAVKLDSAWTALGRHQLSLGGSTALGGRQTGEDLMFALAFRDPGGPPRATGRWDALGRWEPRIRVEAVDVAAERSDPHTALATITYRLVATQSVERVSLAVSVGGGTAG